MQCSDVVAFVPKTERNRMDALDADKLDLQRTNEVLQRQVNYLTEVLKQIQEMAADEIENGSTKKDSSVYQIEANARSALYRVEITKQPVKMVPAKLVLRLIKPWKDRYKNVVDQVSLAYGDLENGAPTAASVRLQGILDQDAQMYADFVNNLNQAFVDAGLEPLEM